MIVAPFSDKIVNVEKVANHPRFKADKAELRKLILDHIGTAARVFDAFAGDGQMYSSVWMAGGNYVGCDKRMIDDDRLAFVADNRRVLRSIDLQQFNIFDLDAYGSPWEQVLIVAARRSVAAGEKIGLCITEGSGLKLKQGGIPNAMKIAAGVSGHLVSPSRAADELIDAAIARTIQRMRCRLVRRWESHGNSASAMRYIALLLEGISDAAERAAGSGIRAAGTVASPS